jgi:phage terminase small subunit
MCLSRPRAGGRQLTGRTTLRPRPKTSRDLISERERRFVERFMASGNATKAAEQAGYSNKTASQIGYRLLRKVQIQAAIADRTQGDPAVWTREDRQRFWTAIASGATRYESATLRDRLKASELLGRSQADFIDRHELEAGPSLVDLLAQSNSLESEESLRLSDMRPAAVRDECQRQHGGKCASMREHAARCADTRWLAGERSLPGDQWRANGERDGKTGLLCDLRGGPLPDVGVKRP